MNTLFKNAADKTEEKNPSSDTVQTEQEPSQHQDAPQTEQDQSQSQLQDTPTPLTDQEEQEQSQDQDEPPSPPWPQGGPCYICREPAQHICPKCSQMHCARHESQKSLGVHLCINCELVSTEHPSHKRVISEDQIRKLYMAVGVLFCIFLIGYIISRLI